MFTKFDGRSLFFSLSRLFFWRSPFPLLCSFFWKSLFSLSRLFFWRSHFSLSRLFFLIFNTFKHFNYSSELKSCYVIVKATRQCMDLSNKLYQAHAFKFKQRTFLWTSLYKESRCRGIKFKRRNNPLQSGWTILYSTLVFKHALSDCFKLFSPCSIYVSI